MCLSPKRIVNRHYLKLADNNYTKAYQLFRYALDFYVNVDCGLCFDCQKKRGRNWRTRLLDEYYYHLHRFPESKVHFCTLTIAPKYYSLFNTNPKAIKMIRFFLERYRKRYGCSFKHFICSEYGEKRGRLHFHMIGFRMLCDIDELRDLWKYGRVDIQTLKGPQGLTYVSGYITKIVHGDKLSDENIPLFIDPSKKTFILSSPGFGLSYALDYSNRFFHCTGDRLKIVNTRYDGSPYAIPRYYKDKIFSPIDLYRMHADYISSTLKLPEPPYRAYNRTFDDFESYLSYLKSIKGFCLLSDRQYSLLPTHLKPYFYGKQ